MSNRDPRDLGKASLISVSHSGNGYEELKSASEVQTHVEMQPISHPVFCRFHLIS